MDGKPGDRQTSLQVRAAVRGEDGGIAWIAERFAPFVRAQVRLRLGAQARPADVDDLAAEVWVVTLQRLGDLRARQGRLTPVLLRFLGQTAIHTCNNHLRRCIRAQPRAAVPMSEVMERTRGVVTRAAGHELGEKLEACLESLPPDQRDVLVLRLMEQRGNREIAEILGLKPNTVAVRYRRALELLRDRLPQRLFTDLLDGRPVRTGNEPVPKVGGS